MAFRTLTSIAVSAAVVFTPTLAAAQNAPKTETSASVRAEISPEEESPEGSELRGGYIIPLAIIVAIILGVLLLTKDDEEPTSP